MRLIFAILLMATAPVSSEAAEQLFSIDDLMIIGDREMMRVFDTVAMRMYHPRCRCFIYLRGGEVEQTKLPLDDYTRVKLFRDIMEGRVTPILREAPGL